MEIESIDLLSFSRIGGAGRVSEKLVRAYRDLEIDSNFLYGLSGNLYSQGIRAPVLTASALIDEMVVKNRAEPAMVSLFRNMITSRSVRSDAQVLQVRWAPGFINPFELARSNPSKLIAWSLPDEFAYTGGCHYSMGCEGHKADCGNCPVVRPAFRTLVSNALSKKRQVFDQVSNLIFTAPSRWLSDRAEQSSLLAGRKVSVIPNPVDDLFFEQNSRDFSDSVETKFLFVAENIDDPIKGLQELLHAFIETRQKNSGVTLTVVGKGRGEPMSLPGVRYVGRISQESLKAVMREHDALVMSSSAEAAGTTIAEASVSGIPSIIPRVGGMSENAGKGALFFRDFRDLTEIMASVEKSQLRDLGGRAREFALENFSAKNVASQYARLFSEELEIVRRSSEA